MEVLKCGICFEQFNLNTHIPYVYGMCGHSICSICIKSHVCYNAYSKCPFCKKVSDIDTQIHKNYKLCDVLSFYETGFCFDLLFLVKNYIKDVPSSCDTHKEKITSFLPFQNKFICEYCVEKPYRSKKLTELIPDIEKYAEDVRKKTNMMEEYRKITEGYFNRLDESIANFNSHKGLDNMTIKTEKLMLNTSHDKLSQVWDIVRTESLRLSRELKIAKNNLLNFLSSCEANTNLIKAEEKKIKILSLIEVTKPIDLTLPMNLNKIVDFDAIKKEYKSLFFNEFPPPLTYIYQKSIIFIFDKVTELSVHAHDINTIMSAVVKYFESLFVLEAK